MKIAILVTRTEKPSARYRILQFIPFLRENGFQTDVYTIPARSLDRIKLFRELRYADIVFLQKKLFGSIELELLRKNTSRFLYDFDDAVMFRDSRKKNYQSRRRMNNFIRTIKKADIIIAGNEYLKDFAIENNSQSYVIPTSLDIDHYTEKPISSPEIKPLILGWIGSSATLFYLEQIRNILDSVFERFPHVSLKIVADRFFDCKSRPSIKKTWTSEEEIDDLHSFDIGLMPLTDDPWSRGKCGLKLLQYMAVGVPAVCSPVGVNADIVVEGINGFFANNDREWLEKLSVLILDRNLRLKLGQEARKTVLSRYSTTASGKKLLVLLTTGSIKTV